jgi:hypothetical protein
MKHKIFCMGMSSSNIQGQAKVMFQFEFQISTEIVDFGE